MDQKRLALMATLSPTVFGPMLQQQLARQAASQAQSVAPVIPANPNPMASISGQYTSQQGGDSGLAPMAMYQAAKRGPAVAQGRGVGGK